MSGAANEAVNELERQVHVAYRATIVAGQALAVTTVLKKLPPFTEVHILDPDEIERRRDPTLRLPRQVRHVDQLLDVILNVKDSVDQRRSLAAHITRLQKRFAEFSGAVQPEAEDDSDDAT